MSHKPREADHGQFPQVWRIFPVRAGPASSVQPTYGFAHVEWREIAVRSDRPESQHKGEVEDSVAEAGVSLVQVEWIVKWNIAMPEDSRTDEVEKFLSEQKSMKDSKQALIDDLLRQKAAAVKAFDEKLTKLGFQANNTGKTKRSHHGQAAKQFRGSRTW